MESSSWETVVVVTMMLRVTWIVSILPILLASIPSSHLQSIHGRVLSFANRGKTGGGTSNKFTVPQSFFLHFYVVAVVWTTVLLMITWFYANKMESHSILLERRDIVWTTIFLLILMEIHVWRRLYESIYVFNYSPSARMHIVYYLMGLLYYIAAPLSLCSISAPEMIDLATYQLTDEFRVKDQLEFDYFGYANPLTKIGWIQWIGAAIFTWGWMHQRDCHAILGSLREHRERPDEYVIPRGDWFEIVSCPHYLAEMVIYAGLVIASGGSDLTIWLLFGIVVTNLVFAAAETHRWYFRKFENYPRTRRAVLPFVY